jgi:hypothetical protein
VAKAGERSKRRVSHKPQTEADFGDVGGWGRESAGGIARESGSFGLRPSEEWKSWPLPWALAAPNAENSTGHCIEKRLGVYYQSIGKSIRKS